MSAKPHNPLAAKRHKARHYGMQALYQWHMAGAPLNEIEAEFRTEYDFSKVDGEFFHDLLHDIPARVDEIDAGYSPYMVERSLDELDPIECALLRIGTWEMMTRIDVPYRVVINEAVNLAKKFGASESHKFVNGVLDKVAAQIRTVEVSADARG
jgi:N utilization substance protein B